MSEEGGGGGGEGVQLEESLVGGWVVGAWISALGGGWDEWRDG